MLTPHHFRRDNLPTVQVLLRYQHKLLDWLSGLTTAPINDDELFDGRTAMSLCAVGSVKMEGLHQ